jgi:PAS domain S-box-containing protein
MRFIKDPMMEIERLQSRLEEAEETLRAIREGEIDALVVAGPQGERIFTLKGSEHLPRLILQEMAEGVVTIVDGNIVYANRCFTQIVKVPSQEIIGQNISHFIAPEERMRFEGLLEASRLDSAAGEFTVVDGRGHLCPVHISFNILESESISGHCLILRNLTELKKAQKELMALNENLELRVAERTQELAVSNENLARSNSELEQFAYVSSHDLQEPLRTIAVYADLLKLSYNDRLDDRGREFLDFIQESSARARELIHGLLAYARVGAVEKEHQPVDMEYLLGRALGNIKALIEENRAEVTHDPLPTLRVNDIEIIQLFQNLISNAIKYRGEDPPKIHVSAKEEGRCWVFSVKDNGIGIEQEYRDYIFMLFKRLHTRAKYSGTGIGLSVCKKIVKAHGGDIWVESKPGEGATFFFTISGQTL